MSSSLFFSPWLFSNVVDASWREANNDESHDDLDERDEQIETTLPYFVMDVKDVRVGCIGLVEKEWLDTVPGFPKEFEYRDMVQVAQNLSRELRQGKEQCELILAITTLFVFPMISKLPVLLELFLKLILRSMASTSFLVVTIMCITSVEARIPFQAIRLTKVSLAPKTIKTPLLLKAVQIFMT